MTEVDVINMLKDGIFVTLKLSAPILLVSMVVGLVIAIFQTTTSLQEQTLTFVPKMLAIFLVLIIFAGWMVQTLVDYTREIFGFIVRL